jgi:hypothetical protein
MAGVWAADRTATAQLVEWFLGASAVLPLEFQGSGSKALKLKDQLSFVLRLTPELSRPAKRVRLE